MNILEEAENLRKLAEEAAKKRGITVQEAWNEAVEIFKSRNKLSEGEYLWNMELDWKENIKSF